MRRLLLLSLVCGGFTASVHAQNDKDLWKQANESSLSQKAKAEFNKHFKPADFRFFSLQEAQLKTNLLNTQSEKAIAVSKSAKTISVPNADGKFEQFRVTESAVMSPKLAAKYPGIKTYIGQGIDDKTASIYFDVTPSGFHAMVVSATKPTYYINPADKASGIYVVNARNEADRSAGFKCEMDKAVTTSLGTTSRSSGLTGNADDGNLRTYDLALCVNGEFSQFFLDGTEVNDAERIAKVMDVLTTCIVRANAVYERDFGVRLQYVANEDTLVFLDPATDPWPTKPPLFGSSWNSKTQQTIDERIGTGNYDIGHLLGKVPTFGDNNGNAGCIGCVCTNSSKGSGFTAYYDPSLIEYMVIDYWTHEMGHQFGANHTFTYSNEGTGANIEPGSGSTIMGYAGITGSTDVQAHSDDLFSVVSIAQVSNYTKTGNGNTCPVTVNTGNTAPTSDAGTNYIIPRSTPFALTGTGADVDASDALTYIWEQVDVFEGGGTSNKFPSATSTTGPVFRVYNDSILPVRVFPALPTILAGQTTSTWEALPSVARDLNFRLTVRDNHVGGGNNKSDEMTVTVNGTAGPFIVTQPNTNVSWNGGSQQTITWDVAGTNVAPINCTNVKISLSTDGGLNFNTVLAANTANDGSEVVTLPNVNSSTCRVKVEAVGNIFFDISNVSFTIGGTGPSCPGQYDTNNNNKAANGAVIPFNTDVYGNISVAGDKDFYRFTITTGGTVSITLNNLPVNCDLALFNSANTIIAQSRNGGTTSETINTTLTPGNYAVRVSARNSAFDAANCYVLKVATGTASRSVNAVSNEAITMNNGSVRIYPNPVTSFLYLNLPASSAKHEVRVYNANGVAVAALSVNTLTTKIDLSKVSAGVYFVKVTDDAGKVVYTTRIVKE